MSINHHAVLDAVLRDLSDVQRQRRLLGTRLLRIQRQLSRLRLQAPHAESSDADSVSKISGMGITEAVRHILIAYPTVLTIPCIRDLLENDGFDMSRYKEPLTSVHVIIKRFVSRGLVVQATAREQAGYLWVAMPAADLGTAAADCDN